VDVAGPAPGTAKIDRSATALAVALRSYHGIATTPATALGRSWRAIRKILPALSAGPNPSNSGYRSTTSTRTVLINAASIFPASPDSPTPNSVGAGAGRAPAASSFATPALSATAVTGTAFAATASSITGFILAL